MIDGTLPDQQIRIDILCRCPVLRMGTVCIAFTEGPDNRRYVIPPRQCIGCGICARRNPDAIQTVAIDW